MSSFQHLQLAPCQLHLEEVRLELYSCTLWQISPLPPPPPPIHTHTPGRSVLMQSEQASRSAINGSTSSVSIDMESVQRDQQNQMQLVEQQVGMREYGQQCRGINYFTNSALMVL